MNETFYVRYLKFLELIFRFLMTLLNQLKFIRFKCALIFVLLAISQPMLQFFNKLGIVEKISRSTIISKKIIPKILKNEDEK